MANSAALSTPSARAKLDAGGAVLDYDHEFFFLNCAIIFIPLTFVFGMTGILH